MSFLMWNDFGKSSSINIMGIFMEMNMQDYWQLFLETGAPEAYLMYSSKLKSEANYVYDHSGHRPESNRLQ